ncbi:MAG: T9SS type A sorting domain-containing protein, partial [Candidatus Delongbacteria bacterium]|nr:T9SS type A sorting domain-containing protein [Candidatus Delongbacteria bacterium]
IVEEDEYVSANSALTESPGGDYGDDVSSFVMWSTPMDWSAKFGASISFWNKYDLEGGFDYMYFEGSPDNGMTWVRLKTWNGEGVGWHEEFISMDGFAGRDQVTFRFLFQSDQGYHVNGMYIDDIMLKTYNNDIASPSFETEPYAPEFYEGTLAEFNNMFRAFDVSGVPSASVMYTVDGGDTLTVAATATGTNDEWNYTIPTQTPGSLVKYWFWAEDGSVEMNSGYSDSYTYIAGEHLIYDNGIVSYISNIIVGDAMAVRMTVPGSDATTTYGADLSYLLLKNYADLDTSSDSMTVHVWQDDGTGQPGVEVLTPFQHLPEANTLVDPEAMSMLDLRSEGIRVYGDFWIGFSAEIGDVYYCYTQPSELGSTNYNRSFNGLSNGDGTWAWSQAGDTNYHFRAIIGAFSSIEEVHAMPISTSLEQNYPNPFNPTTTINFTIASEAKVSLVVYDVMGRSVAKLVDGDLSQGSHKVSFDASNLVSGVYYYNLKSGNVNQTKKMMLIK